MLRKLILSALFVAAATLALPATSDAGFSLEIKINGTSVDKIDVGTADNISTGLVPVSKTLGNGDKIFYRIESISNSPGSPTLGFLSSTSVTIYGTKSDGTALGTSHRVDLIVIDDTYTEPASSPLSAFMRVTVLNGFNAATELGSGPSQNSFTSTLTGTSSATTDTDSFAMEMGGAWRSNTVLFTQSTGYTARQDISVLVDSRHTTAAMGIRFQADTNINPVPAPAGIALVATALPFVALLRRRFRKSDVATVA